MSSKDSCPDSKLKQQTSAEKKGIKELDISEAGLYAYGAICALTLAELFSDPSDHAYNNLCMKMICQHLKMNEKNEPVMMYLSEGKSEQSQEPYIALLMEEPNLKGKTILVVQDLVLLAVRNGEKLAGVLGTDEMNFESVFHMHRVAQSYLARRQNKNRFTQIL